MGFTEHLSNKLIKFQISDNDHKVYTRQAQALINHVIEELKKKDLIFADIFQSLSLCGSYLDQVKLDVPDEFDLHMKLKFPFKVTPKAKKSGFVSLWAEFEPMSMKVEINGTILQDWLQSLFKKVLTTDIILNYNGEKYKLSYRVGAYGCAHTIKAVSKNRAISIDLVPAFEFTWSEWPFAAPPVPQDVRIAHPWLATALLGPTADGKTFIVSAPLWENALLKDNTKFKDVLRLMKGLRDANKNRLPELSSYMIKTVILHQVGKVDWGRDLSDLLMEMWSCLVAHLREGQLQFFLIKGGNLFSRMLIENRKICLVTANELLESLRVARLGIDKFDEMFTV